MAWKLPRFHLRALLLAIAVFAALLGAGIWYFTPRMLPVRLDPTTDGRVGGLAGNTRGMGRRRDH